jgi:Ca2+-binding RTX toxin-like protein
MPTFNGTAGNDSWTVITGGDFTIDGKDGVDTINFGIVPRSDFIIQQNTDGSINVDTLSGASDPMHATLKSVEKLVFNSGTDRVDLATLFPAPVSTGPLTVGADNAPLAGTAGNDTMAGDARNNVFFGSTGSDTIDGGAGVDKLQLLGARSSYTVALNGNSATVSDGAGNTMALSNVERIQFSDATIALDIAGNGGQVYRVYQAAFNRVPDGGGLGFWINAMDTGSSLVSIAQGFVNSAEFKALYGANPTNTSMVSTMYTNVLHRAPDNAGIAFWVSVLDNHQATPADVLMGFSESAENQQALIGVIGNGFAYTPFG